MQTIKRLIALNAHIDNLLRQMLDATTDELRSEFAISLGDFNMLAEELSESEPVIPVAETPGDDVCELRTIIEVTPDAESVEADDARGDEFTEPEETEAFNIADDDDDEPTEAVVSVITADDEAAIEAEAISMAIEEPGPDAEDTEPANESEDSVCVSEVTAVCHADDADECASGSEAPAADMNEDSVIPSPVYADYADACDVIKVDEMLSRRESIDFRHAFTLNDKYRFRRELFGGSEIEFADAVNMVIAMQSYDEACDYFYITLQWDAADPEVKDFMKIVENHFKAIKS